MNDVQFDGYIDKIQLNGKTYALKCTIVETHPLLVHNAAPHLN